MRLLVAMLVSCTGAPVGDGPEVSAKVGCQPPEVDPNAVTVAATEPPEACGNGTADMPAVFHGAAELAAAGCDPAKWPAFDWAKVDLYVFTDTMSPAWGGSQLVDEGATLTYVTRFRSPCPDDPLPMPIDRTFAFAVAKGDRAWRQANCTLPPACN